MASKQLYDKRSQARQTQRTGTIAHLYYQRIATSALVAMSFARVVRTGVTAIVARLKQLALPAGQPTVAAMLKKGVNARLGEPTLHPRQHVSFAGL